MYQAEGAVFSPQQVGEEAREVGLVSPAPAGRVEARGDGKVDVGHEPGDETHSQGHQEAERQPLTESIHIEQVSTLIDSSRCSPNILFVNGAFISGNVCNHRCSSLFGLEHTYGTGIPFILFQYDAEIII